MKTASKTLLLLLLGIVCNNIEKLQAQERQVENFLLEQSSITWEFARDGKYWLYSFKPGDPLKDYGADDRTGPNYLSLEPLDGRGSKYNHSIIRLISDESIVNQILSDSTLEQGDTTWIPLTENEVVTHLIQLIDSTRKWEVEVFKQTAFFTNKLPSGKHKVYVARINSHWSSGMLIRELSGSMPACTIHRFETRFLGRYEAPREIFPTEGYLITEKVSGKQSCLMVQQGDSRGHKAIDMWVRTIPSPLKAEVMMKNGKETLVIYDGTLQTIKDYWEVPVIDILDELVDQSKNHGDIYIYFRDHGFTFYNSPVVVKLQYLRSVKLTQKDGWVRFRRRTINTRWDIGRNN